MIENKTYKSGEKMTFGKYKGQTIDKVMQFDPSYVDWMYSERICDLETIHRKDEGRYKHKKFKSDGYAVVF